MKRKEPKAKFVRGAEEMFDEVWAWGGRVSAADLC